MPQSAGGRSLGGFVVSLGSCTLLYRSFASLPSRVRAGETHVDLNIRVPNLPQFALLADELPRAWKAGTPWHERHPVVAALFLGALRAR